MEVSIKNTHIVKPLKPTHEGIYHLSELDQIGMITHVPTVYFYKPSREWLGSSRFIISTLKESLSRVLVHFYPLAGRVYWVGQGRLDLHCNAAGVELIEAESSGKLSDFGDFASETSLFDNLVPLIDYGKPIVQLPLLLVQLTKFKCGGICLGINISHVIADGQSALHFMSEWARLARGEPLKVAPYFDPDIFRAQYLPKTQTISNKFDIKFQSLPLLIGQENNSKERKNETTVSILTLSKDLVFLLKKRVSKESNTTTFFSTCLKYLFDSFLVKKFQTFWGGGYNNNNNNMRPYTRYEVVTAHIWKSCCKARKNLPDQQTYLNFSLDVRNRVHPPLPPKYFGNAIIDVVASSRSGDIISKPLRYACSKIREAMEKVDNEYIMSNIECWKNMVDLSYFQDLSAFKGEEAPFNGNPNLGVISWLTLPLYGLDFGWGKEVYMGPSTHDSDGDCIILPGPVNDGSVKVAVCLQVAHMDAFKKYFYEDISSDE